ncbi:unnamed protein product [Sphenostylis stenocarpa]|uniref:LOB domain-containing protein n=1 Tax=Sphenostylis stenocarpa TaxID=92480 RepID=A0AA86W303_9FABA|nr:unnamed protein product [Sphenostylis stenocarpa]
MKLSCNGCRILRKGCSENCIIRSCLEWINSPESQANATLFLAKFYGRTGFLSLITAAPQHLRPVVFRSLLYEACGRLVNPTYGSLGLFWTGEWAQCEAAVEAVLTGSKINNLTFSPSKTSETLASNRSFSTFDMQKETNVEAINATEFKRVHETKLELELLSLPINIWQ